MADTYRESLRTTRACVILWFNMSSHLRFRLELELGLGLRLELILTSVLTPILTLILKYIT